MKPDNQTLIADIDKRYISNVFWRLSFSRIRSIKAADDWWQRCINHLTLWCNIIVVDLTVVKAGTRWELQKLHDDRLGHKTMLSFMRKHMITAVSTSLSIGRQMKHHIFSGTTHVDVCWKRNNSSSEWPESGPPETAKRSNRNRRIK